MSNQGLTMRNREHWLADMAEGMRPWFKDLGYDLPPVRMAIGFPSTGNKGKRIGECWTDAASGDGTHEIFITPKIDDALYVAGILCHELVHAAVGIPAGHGPKFRKCALAVGLEGKMKHALPGDALNKRIAELLKRVGPLPHAKLSDASESNAPKKQTARMIKCECPTCGYTVRTARKWLIEVGAPICPQDQIAMTHEDLDVEDLDNDSGGESD